MGHGCGRCWYEYDGTHGRFVEKGGRRGDLQVGTGRIDLVEEVERLDDEDEEDRVRVGL